MTIARPADYWFSTYAIFIQLNATGDRNYIHANCSSGSMVMCYMRGITGLGYDNAHNYRRWPLIASPTVFHDNLARYVYIAIPKSEDADAVAQVVFPSELIDIYGCNEGGTQIGPDSHYYIFTQGVISPSEVGGVVQNRTWQQVIDSGQLASDESIAAGGSDSWWEYIASSDMVKFIKTIAEATFEKLTASWASIKQLVLNGKPLNSVASDKTKDNAQDAVVTPAYAHSKFLSKIKNDRAKGKIVFEKGAFFGVDENAVIDEKGDATLLSLIVKTLLRSPDFRNGFTGEGWKLWLEDGLAKMELDELTVRHIMHVFELIIDKLRSVGGQIVVSAANGKIKIIEDQGESYKIIFEQANTYVVDDQMRCSTFRNGKELRGYWVKIAESVPGVEEGTGYVIIPKSEFDGQSLPEVGDETALMGNTTNTKRQNLIIISATEDGEPRIDILDGVHEKNFTGCLRARFGNLDGIDDDWFPKDNQPHGNGIYADNAYLRGTFLLTTGEDIKTKFEIVEGKITSEIDSVRNELTESKGLLRNPSFINGFDYWVTDVGYDAFSVGGNLIWANENILGRKGSGVFFFNDNGMRVLQICDGGISQNSNDFLNKPEFKTNEKGEKVPVTVYVSFMYKVVEAGQLRFGIVDQEGENFENYEYVYYNKSINQTEDYKQLTFPILWDGTGCFEFTFYGGEIRIYGLTLSTNEADTLAYRYKSLFEQSSTLVKIATENFDKDGNVINQSQILTKAEYNLLISEKFNTDGTLKNSAGLVTTTDFNTFQNDLDVNLRQVVEDIYDEIRLGDLELDKELGNYVSIESFSAMFSDAVDANGLVNKAYLATYVTKDSNGYLQSGVRISGDQIDMAGKVNINNKFKVKLDGSIEAVDGVFSGQITATSGKIGNFTIKDGSIITETDGSLQIGTDDFKNTLGTTISTKEVTVQGGIDSSIPSVYSFKLRENNRLVLKNTTNHSYDWQNIAVANAINMDYFSSDSATMDNGNRYGYQYAMLGSGHVCMNGIIDGMCLDIMKNFSTDKEVKLIQPPLWCNRIAVNTKYNKCNVILPDRWSMYSCLGFGITKNMPSTEQEKKFSFRIDIINTGTLGVGVCGYSTEEFSNGNTPLKDYIFPVLFNNGVQVKSLSTVIVKPFTIKSFLLVYTGNDYFAFNLN